MTRPRRFTHGPATAFFSVVGSQDPAPEPGGVQGPALDLLEALIGQGAGIRRVLLGWTPGAACENWPGGYDARVEALERAVRGQWPDMQVSRFPLDARPNSAPEVLRALASALEGFRHEGTLHVNTSSGTPQMLEALKVLRGTGWFDRGRVKLWQLDRPQHRQPGVEFVREAATPFLEETIKLKAGFAALDGFDFAGAGTIFAELGSGPLELPQRAQSVGTLSDVADVLALMDSLNLEAAVHLLDDMPQHVPALVEIADLVRRGRADDEAWIWLMWGRYNRAWALGRVADALVWAVALHELLVVKLASRYGLPDTDQLLREADLPEGLFALLQREAPRYFDPGKRAFKFKDLQQKLTLLRAPSLGVANVDTFDAGNKDRETPNPALSQVRQWRNLVLHQGRAPYDVSLDRVDEVIQELLRAFPFQQEWSRRWVEDPDAVPVSAQALVNLSQELQEWVG